MKSNITYDKISKTLPINEITKGSKVSGFIKNIQPYGAFIHTDNGLEGLLYIEDISVARIKTPFERFKIGQRIDVLIKDVDLEKNKIYFSYKELLGTWEDNVKEFKEKTVVQGIVRETEKNKRGIFIELKPNLVGMAEYKEGMEYGQKVDVYIKKIVEDKKKIKLIIK